MSEIDKLLSEAETKVKSRLRRKYRNNPAWQEVLDTSLCPFRFNCKYKNTTRILVQCFSPVGYRTCEHFKRQIQSYR